MPPKPTEPRNTPEQEDAFVKTLIGKTVTGAEYDDEDDLVLQFDNSILLVVTDLAMYYWNFGDDAQSANGKKSQPTNET